MEYVNKIPQKSNLDMELDHLYRRFVSKCDYLRSVQKEIKLLKIETELHEKELQKVNNEVIFWRFNYMSKARELSVGLKDTSAKFHNITNLYFPTRHNKSLNNYEPRPLHLEEEEDDDIRLEDIGEFIRSMDSDVCTGDIIYIESLLKESTERFAIISPDGELILHDDLMTIMFDKSLNTHNPEPYKFIKERNIKFGNMFKYIIKNKDNNICEAVYNCSFNNWRTNEEVEQIIKYYIKKNLWI